jgi:phage shock protein PspC (stress-responsive transcriptional regulator)
MNSDIPQMHPPGRLTRSTADKMLGGVAGGLARYFSIDPIVVRVGFAVTTLFTGAGLLAYLALLVFVPADDSAPSGAAAVPA